MACQQASVLDNITKVGSCLIHENFASDLLNSFVSEKHLRVETRSRAMYEKPFGKAPNSRFPARSAIDFYP